MIIIIAFFTVKIGLTELKQLKVTKLVSDVTWVKFRL